MFAYTSTSTSTTTCSKAHKHALKRLGFTYTASPASNGTALAFIRMTYCEFHFKRYSVYIHSHDLHLRTCYFFSYSPVASEKKRKPDDTEPDVLPMGKKPEIEVKKSTMPSSTKEKRKRKESTDQTPKGLRLGSLNMLAILKHLETTRRQRNPFFFDFVATVAQKMANDINKEKGDCTKSNMNYEAVYKWIVDHASSVDVADASKEDNQIKLKGKVKSYFEKSKVDKWELKVLSLQNPGEKEPKKRFLKRIKDLDVSLQGSDLVRNGGQTHCV